MSRDRRHGARLRPRPSRPAFRPLAIILVVVLALTSLGLAGCRKAAPPGEVGKGSGQPGPDSTQPGTPDSVAAETPPLYPEQQKWSDPGAFKSPTVTAKLQPYTIAAGLANVANRGQFGEFEPDLLKALTQSGFAIAPTAEQQLFYIYENNAYLKVPSFITTDSILQVYHVFYDFVLRRTETSNLYPKAREFTTAMLGNLVKLSAQKGGSEAARSEVNSNLDRLQAYFLVAATLLGADIPQGISGSVQAMADDELQLIRAAGMRQQSAIFPFQLDYTQFIPRGHYTRGEELKQYFLGMMWYGQVPFPFKLAQDGGGEATAVESIIEASLLTYALYQPGPDGQPMVEAWKDLYEPTVFFVGQSDDLTPIEYKALLDKVYGQKAGPLDFVDRVKLARMAEEGSKLRQPRIVNELIGIPSGAQMRFMGQRYIPDSEILQRLSKWPERPMPSGLDVATVLGSARAEDHLLNLYQEDQKWCDYVPRLSALKTQFGAMSAADWQTDVYHGWLWALKAMYPPKVKGYPSFMTSQAWSDKVLNTTLASWAELRHDTLLYAKASGAECGGDGPPEVLGYVEPEVEFYARLGWLTEKLAAGLEQRGYLNETMREKFYYFRRMIRFLEDVSQKELAGEPLTRQEYEQILVYGGSLEYMTTSVIDSESPYGASHWFLVENETDRNMAVIADIHTAAGECLEAGVGPAYEIFVVVPIEGKLYLTRGAVFSYYEFTQPTSGRLTDEAWQQKLKDGAAPPQPEWLQPSIKGKKKAIPQPTEVYNSGC